MAVMLKTLMAAVVGLVVAGMATAAEAAVIYTSQASFDLAVAGKPMKWSEDFEGFAPGPISGPLSIGGGQAEIFTNGQQEIFSQSETGNIAYWNVETQSHPVALGPETTITATGAPPRWGAFSFGYNMGGVRDNIWEIEFISNRGSITTTLFETSVSYPHGENGQDIPLFMGWLGGQGELLFQIVVKPAVTGILLDDFRAYSVRAVPLPATLGLILAGLGMIGAAAWKQRRVSARLAA